MSINTHLGKTVNALTGITTLTACTTELNLPTTLVPGGDINGDVIDRLGHTRHLNGGEYYNVATPFLCAYATGGTTMADRKATMTIKLQHGDSSGAGDMADLVTAATTDPEVTINQWSSALSTDHANWFSAGPIHLSCQGASYNISQFASRYLRVVGSCDPPAAATTGATDQLYYVTMGVHFSEPTLSPPTFSSTMDSTTT